MINKLITSFLTSILYLFVSYSVSAQTANETNNESTFSIQAQIRPRAEFRQGVFQPLPSGKVPAAFISQRNRLIFNYQYNQQIEVRLSPQNVAIWGQDALATGAVQANGISFYEAWVRLKLSKFSTFQIGRQVISLDDERFFGELDWAQGGRAHDAITYIQQHDKFTWKLYAAYNQNYKELYGNNLSNISGSLFTAKDAAPYKWMQTAWGRYMLNPANSLSVLISNLGFQQSKNALDSAQTYYLQTFGLNYFSKSERWNAHLSAYYQAGKNASGDQTDAYLLSIGANRKLSKWSIGLGGDYLSGNQTNPQHPALNRAFVPYFGTNHKFYGSMDYYYAGNGHRNSGLIDMYLNAGYKSIKNWDLSLALHQFASAHPVYNQTQELSTNLGQELDLGFNVSFNPFTKLSGGYSLYLATSSLLALKGVVRATVEQHWLWLSLNINPQIFSTTNKSSN